MSDGESKHIKTECARTLVRKGKLEQFRGAYRAAGEHYQNALNEILQIHQQECGRTGSAQECPACCVEIAAIWLNQAKLADDRGDYEFAEEHYLKALPVYEEQMKQERINRSLIREYVNAEYDLALFYHQRWQEYNLAAEHYCQAARISNQRWGGQAPETLQIVAGQALLEMERVLTRWERPTQAEINGQWVQVKAKYESAFRACQLAPIPRNIAQGFLANNLAVIHQRSGDLDRAADWYDRAVNLHKENGWTDHFSYAVLLTNYAKFLQEREEVARAHHYYGQAEGVYQDAQSGRPQPFYQVADFLYEYVQIFSDAGREERLKKLDAALEIYSGGEPTPGLGHEKVFQALQAYGSLCRYGNEEEQLKRYYEQLLDKYRSYVESAGNSQRPGPRLQLARIEHAYAYWLGTQQKHDLARQHYQAALERHSEIRIPEHFENKGFQSLKALKDRLQLLKRCNAFLLNDLHAQWTTSKEEREHLAGLKMALGRLYNEAQEAYQRQEGTNSLLFSDFEQARQQFNQEIAFDRGPGGLGNARSRRWPIERRDDQRDADHRGLTLLW
jgi:tetratricopeptide (TPR) repeat protein